MHITAYISQSNLKDVVQNITQIIDVIIGKTPCILLLVTALSVQEMSIHFLLRAGFLPLSQFPEPFRSDTNVRYVK